MFLLNLLFYLLFVCSILQKAVGDKLLRVWAARVGLAAGLTTSILQNLELFFILGCAFIMQRYLSRIFMGERR